MGSEKTVGWEVRKQRIRVLRLPNFADDCGLKVGDEINADVGPNIAYVPAGDGRLYPLYRGDFVARDPDEFEVIPLLDLLARATLPEDHPEFYAPD
jgi:hypothetical protein